MEVPVPDPDEMNNFDSEEEPNHTGTITSTYNIMVKYLHHDNLDDNLDKDDEEDRSVMGVDRRFQFRNRIIQECYNVVRGNEKTYEYHHVNIRIQTS